MMSAAMREPFTRWSVPEEAASRAIEILST